MIFYMLSIVIIIKLYVLMRYFSKKEVKNCFTPENFDKVMEYTRWKLATSKIGKVIVDGYLVEISADDEILFKKGEEHYTLFKINREEGIVLLAVKHRESLRIKADNAFCELLSRAIFHPVNPAPAS